MEPRYRSALGLALAGLGRNEEAIREGEEGLRLMPPEKEAWRGAWRVADLAQIEAMTGREDEAIERLRFLLSVPSDFSVWLLRLDPAWDPLRENPGFEALPRRGREAVDLEATLRPRLDGRHAIEAEGLTACSPRARTRPAPIG